MQCTLCNEQIDEVELEFDDAFKIEDEYWHADCFDEYFDDDDLN